MNRLGRLLRGLGPAMPRPAPTEAIRAALGAGLGLALTGVILWMADSSGTGGPLDHPHLIAPFAASAFLIFAVPNSPLAQPWAVVVGNILAAYCALVLLAILPALPLLTAPLAVGLSILLMAALRALHPPAGAVAMATVLLNPVTSAGSPDWAFALHPILAGSLCLVGCGVLWNRATGRSFPFRQPAAGPSPHGTADSAPDRRLAPSPEALALALDRLRLGANLGVEDLARLIAATDTETTALALGNATAAQIMSRDLITVRPKTELPELAEIFRQHRFKTLPVTDAEGGFLGLVPQSALVGLADPDLTALDLADPALQPVAPDTPFGDLIPRLADGRQQTLPVVEDDRLVGLISRSDLIALLIRRLGAT